MSLAGTRKVRNLAPRHVSHCFSCCSKHVIPPPPHVLPVLLSVSLPICLPDCSPSTCLPGLRPHLSSLAPAFFFSAFLMRACVTQAFRKPLLITWQASRSGTLMKRDSELETPLEWWWLWGWWGSVLTTGWGVWTCVCEYVCVWGVWGWGFWRQASSLSTSESWTVHLVLSLHLQTACLSSYSTPIFFFSFSVEHQCFDLFFLSTITFTLIKECISFEQLWLWHTQLLDILISRAVLAFFLGGGCKSQNS